MSDPNPFERHAADVASSQASGDPTAIKQAYRRLGDYLHDAYPEGASPPQLSWAETCAVVVGAVPRSARRVLDAGCGPNPATSIALARPERVMVGLDIGWGTVDLACRVARAAGVTLHGVVGDVEHLPIRSGIFDAVVCDDTIEHVPDDRAAAAELSRCVASGGTLVVATPNRRRLDVIGRRARDRVRGRSRRPADYFATASHLREYTPDELEAVLADRLVVVGRLSVGWDRSTWLKRVGTWMVTTRPLRSFTRVAVVVARPKRG